MRIGGIVLAAALAAPAGLPATLVPFARTCIEGPGDLQRLQEGEVLARVVDTDDGTEVFAVAVARVRTTRAATVACFESPECLRDSEGLRRAGRLSATPVPSDLSLGLEPAQVAILRRCRPGRCGLRLPETAIVRLGGEHSGDDAGAAARADELLREVLAGLARDYLARGDAALPVYADRPAPIASAESLAVLTARAEPALSAVPGLVEHLRAWPLSHDPARDALHWHVERLYRKTLFGVHHVAVFDTPAATAAVTKQVYSSAYFNAALELTALVGNGAGEGYLVLLSRVRTDVRPSGFTWIERLLLRRMVPSRLRDRLARMRARLQSGAPLLSAR